MASYKEEIDVIDSAWMQVKVGCEKIKAKQLQKNIYFKYA